MIESRFSSIRNLCMSKPANKKSRVAEAVAVVSGVTVIRWRHKKWWCPDNSADRMFGSRASVTAAQQDCWHFNAVIDALVLLEILDKEEVETHRQEIKAHMAKARRRADVRKIKELAQELDFGLYPIYGKQLK